jgi:hypothetical protein
MHCCKFCQFSIFFTVSSCKKNIFRSEKSGQPHGAEIKLIKLFADQHGFNIRYRKIVFQTRNKDGSYGKGSGGYEVNLQGAP